MNRTPAHHYWSFNAPYPSDSRSHRFLVPVVWRSYAWIAFEGSLSDTCRGAHAVGSSTELLGTSRNKNTRLFLIGSMT